ncbi:MAG: hypothetical protein ACR2LR_14780 [Hassallia sp.]
MHKPDGRFIRTFWEIYKKSQESGELIFRWVEFQSSYNRIHEQVLLVLSRDTFSKRQDGLESRF